MLRHHSEKSLGEKRGIIDLRCSLRNRARSRQTRCRRRTAASYTAPCPDRRRRPGPETVRSNRSLQSNTLKSVEMLIKRMKEKRRGAWGWSTQINQEINAITNSKENGIAKKSDLRRGSSNKKPIPSSVIMGTLEPKTEPLRWSVTSRPVSGMPKGLCEGSPTAAEERVTL